MKWQVGRERERKLKRKKIHKVDRRQQSLNFDLKNLAAAVDRYNASRRALERWNKENGS
jgi:hypothetical protein